MNKPVSSTLINKGKLFIILLLLCLLLVVHMLIALAGRNALETAIVDNPPSLSDANGQVNRLMYKNSYRIQGYAAELGQQHSLNSKEAKDTQVVEATVHAATAQNIEVSVYITEDQSIEIVPLEDYVFRVALAELPLSFSMEAVKAQMIAIRTYIIHRMQNEMNKLTNEQLNASYWVTDTTQHQVYVSGRKLQELMNNEKYEQQLNKFKQASHATSGQIIVYKEQPIEAVFFSTSNGYTEAAEDYWGNQVEYLQSVPSKWDAQISPSYKQAITYTYEQLYTRLNLLTNNNSSVKPHFTQISYTDSKRIASISINDKIFTGKELREKLELASTHIQWEIMDKEQQITFSTYGYGHGVGLSQWGANGMAQEGYLAEDIIKHYYQGVSIEQASKLVKNY